MKNKLLKNETHIILISKETNCFRQGLFSDIQYEARGALEKDEDSPDYKVTLA